MYRKLVAALGLSTLIAVAVAPSTGGAQSVDPGATTTSQGAGSLLRDALRARKAPAKAAIPSTAQPAASADPGFGFETPRPGIQHPSVPGVHYSLDLSSAFPYGDIGFKQNHLPGGVDGVIWAGPDKYTRAQLGYYTLSEYPIGFDTGKVPAYVLNGAIPVLGPLLGPGRQSCANLNGLNGGKPLPNCPADLNAAQNDATVQNRIFVASLSRLVYLTPMLPVVITPTYVARKGSIGGSDDVFAIFNPDTQGVQTVHLRTVETKAVYLTVPLANSPKLFAAYTIGPQWLLNTNGLNKDNHAQLFQFMDIRYFANDKTTVFLQPSRLQNYLPNDPYPQRIPTIIAGVSRQLAKPFFIQAFIASGTPVNPPHGETGRVGVIDVTCIDLTTCTNSPTRQNTAVTLGGLKATMFVLQFGIGTPTVIPL